MRQAGVLAAAGIVALDKMVSRLADDHVRARALADGLRTNPKLKLDDDAPATNMVYVALAEDSDLSASELIEKLKSRGILVGKVDDRRIRLVTHCWIDDQAVKKSIAGFNEVLAD